MGKLSGMIKPTILVSAKLVGDLAILRALGK